MRQPEAAVGLIVQRSEVLFIKRKARPDDPWSGDIAFPGGFLKEMESPAQAVIREIKEEVSLYFTEYDILAEMPLHYPISKQLPVHPFIIKSYSFDDALPGDEVDEIKIADIGDLVKDYDEKKGNIFRFGDWIIWGLTYRILNTYITRYYGNFDF
ncbi:mutator protein [MutT] [Thermoplasma volcanium GSS1]|uniref:Mutator protein [MutT] n=1 Tax=Thermoplasma volcanium (strain ATCC 51530 / DSM 4299 / JCM 9571 / NBRC 15438 / GSS1) TaxID=273116 RepID=Q978Y3_THEVO|nr:NUDIX domain-containing protein [Thermoplasma volcanium]BAB60423.1 mutator protein [MutT] [Thermoplasma volcanium GSS1]